MLTLSLKFKSTSDYLAVLRIIHKPDVIKEDTRFAYVGIHHRGSVIGRRSKMLMDGDSAVNAGNNISR
jgi:hypothetical protein